MRRNTSSSFGNFLSGTLFMVSIRRKRITQKQYAAIGNVCVAWLDLKTTIELSIWACGKLGWIMGPKITSELFRKTRYQMLLAMEHDPKQPDDTKKNKNQSALYYSLVKIGEEINQIAGERNAIVHGDWRRDQDNPSRLSRVAANAKGKMHYYTEARTPENMNQIAKDIFALSDKLYKTLKAHGRVPIPS